MTYSLRPGMSVVEEPDSGINVIVKRPRHPYAAMVYLLHLLDGTPLMFAF
jgi:hypothetical protein